MSEFLPYALPLIGEEEVEAVTEVLRSNWLTTGAKTRRFEEVFSNLLGGRYAVAVNSCTAGLHALLKAAGVGPGDEVIVPAMTFCATANVVMHLGARPVMVDIDPLSFALTAENAEKAITPRTKAIMPVHYAGNPCDMEPLWELAKAKNLAVIEDAAHAVGTYYRGEHVGTRGDGASFSFYATKNITTGEGGMLIGRPEWEDRLRQLTLHGLSKNAYNRYEKGGSWYYEVTEPGFKYNMTDIQSAIGLAQFEKLERMQSRRAWMESRYREAFQSVEQLILPPQADESKGDRHSWHLYLLRLDPHWNRNAFIGKLTDAGIGTSVHYIPLHLHPAYKELGYEEGDFPISEGLYRQEVSLPLYPAMSDESVQRVIDAVLSAAKEM